MKITILTENNSRIDNYLLAEPGFCALIEHNNKKILFDTGYSDTFIKNSTKLNLSFNDITDIVISHGHQDHTKGLTFLNIDNKDIKFTAHPKIFDIKVDKDKTHLGCAVSQKELNKKYTLNLTTKPYYICDDLLFLGEIQNNNTVNIDDSALAYITSKGLFIITGCSHSGIINIINYAKKVTNENRIYGVIGGFHLIHKTETELEEIAKFFHKEKVTYLAPCHCCNLQSKIVLSKFNKIKEICVGDIISL